VKFVQAGKAASLPLITKGDGLKMRAGDVVEVGTPGGGGYGDPGRRGSDRVDYDLKQGYVLPARQTADARYDR
jgi:N-methylhydantoinase B